MAGESLIIGDGNWGVKSDSLLGYAVNSGRFVPRDLTFTRATTGTRTNGALLVETTPYNLLQYSEQLENGVWSQLNSSIVSNFLTSPNGTLTADKIVESNAAGFHGPFQLLSGNVGTTYTYSVYLKAAERTWALVWFDADGAGAYFNLSNGSLGTVSSGVTASSINAGNGWYRCSITKTISTAANARIFLANGNNVVSYTGDGTSGIYAWGAQVVEGSSVLDYLPTTTRLNIPRVDYSTGTAALLLEPQRTNISTGSENMGASWLPIGGTLTPNSTTSPSGLLNAAKLTVTTANGYAYRDIVTVASTVYTFSVYIRSATGSDVNGALNAGAGSINFVANNTWQRFSLTFTASAALTTFYIGGFSSLSLGEDIFIWGAQVEVGSYPTSYIPTTSASVTRNADTCLRTGISNLIGQTEGTLFIDFVFKTPTNVAGGQVAVTSNSVSIYDRVIIWNNSTTNTLAALVQANNALIYNISLGSFVDGTRYKIAIAYKSGDSVFYVDGIQVGSSSASFSFSAALTTFILGAYELAGFSAHQRNNSSMIFMNRLSNSQLATLTKK